MADVQCWLGTSLDRIFPQSDVSTGRHVAQNRTYDLYKTVKARFESIEAGKLVLDTGTDLAECVRLALLYIRE